MPTADGGRPHHDPATSEQTSGIIAWATKSARELQPPHTEAELPAIHKDEVDHDVRSADQAPVRRHYANNMPVFITSTKNSSCSVT